MKRDLSLVLAAALGVAALLSATSPPSPEPQRPLLQRAARWAVLWFLARPAPTPVQSVPDHLVNAPANRTLGPEGEPLLDHGDGW